MKRTTTVMAWYPGGCRGTLMYRARWYDDTNVKPRPLERQREIEGSGRQVRKSGEACGGVTRDEELTSRGFV